MTWDLSTAANLARRNAALTAVIAAIDGGSGAGTIQIRTGASPGANNAATGTLLATVTLIDPSFGSVSSASATLADPVAVTAVATGTAAHCRVLDSSDNVIMDGTVTATGGGGDLTLASVAITSGQSVDVTGGTLTQPAS
jgi:hypothetical protein